MFTSDLSIGCAYRHITQRFRSPRMVIILPFDYIGYQRLSENKRFPNHRWYSDATCGGMAECSPLQKNLKIIWIRNRDHSPNFFRQTSLLFHKWLAERFNLDDAWIVNVRYKDTSICNALITWIGKFCTFRSQTKLFSRLFLIL